MGNLIGFWVGLIFGRLSAALMILSLVLAFVSNQTRKNIIIAGVTACLITTFIGFCGNINGRLLTWNLTEHLLLRELIFNIVSFSVMTALVIWRQWNTKKWFAKVIPWVAGIIYGGMLCLSLPAAIQEQYEIRHIAREMTLKQLYELPDNEQRIMIYKINGMPESFVFGCVDGGKDIPELHNYKLREVVEGCRNLMHKNMSESTE